MSGNGAGAPERSGASEKSFGSRPIRAKPMLASVAVDLLVVVCVVLVVNVVFGVDSPLLTGAIAGALVGGFGSALYRSLYDRIETPH